MKCRQNENYNRNLTCDDDLQFLAEYGANIVAGDTLIGTSILASRTLNAMVLIAGEVSDGLAVFQPAIRWLWISCRSNE